MLNGNICATPSVSAKTLAISGVLAFASLFCDRNESQAGEPGETPDKHHGFAIVELFTSQGCSSCPPADKNLARVCKWAEKNKQPVYCLSYHVDYWNRLGWHDPYSRAAFSQRQRSYAKALQAESIYTPQIIINGHAYFVGSRVKETNQAVVDALGEKAQLSVQVTAEYEEDHKHLLAKYSVISPPPDTVLQIAIVQREASDHVESGENRGRDLQHVNVVRELKSADLNHANRGTMAFELPSDSDIHDYSLIAFVQDRSTFRILAAADSRAPD